MTEDTTARPARRKPQSPPPFTASEIAMSELLAAQRKIDENNVKAGIIKKPITRTRSPGHLPIANK